MHKNNFFFGCNIRHNERGLYLSDVVKEHFSETVLRAWVGFGL